MKISVIIPVYNSALYLDDLFLSLMRETMQDFEIIAIDDASLDQSFNILLAWQKKYPQKIHVYRNKVNLGQGASRNIGLKYAKGEYISFIDSDDYIHSQMFQDMYWGAKEHNMPNIISTNIIFVKENSTYLNEYNSIRNKGILVDINKEPYKIIYQSPSCGNKLFKREFIANSEFLVDTMWEDAGFTYSHLFLAKQILTFNNPDYYYRKHVHSGVSAKGYQVNQKLLDIFKVAFEIERKAKEADRYRQFEKEIKLVQVIICLHRIREILDWDIDEKDKKILVQDMYHLIRNKYASIKDLDEDCLNMRTDYYTLQLIRELPLLNKSLDQTVENIENTLKLRKK